MAKPLTESDDWFEDENEEKQRKIFKEVKLKNPEEVTEVDSDTLKSFAQTLVNFQEFSQFLFFLVSD